jgi:four helix bundle protein
MHPFRKLKVWQKAHQLVLRTYRATNGMSSSEYPGLPVQIRKAAQSIPSNISEGAGRDTSRQFAYHLEIAIGSARELDYLMLLAHDLGAIPNAEYQRLAARVDQVCAMTVSLRKKVLGPTTSDSSRRRSSKPRSLPSPVPRPPSRSTRPPLPTPPSD